MNMSPQLHLTFSFGESRERSVTIKEVDPETLKALLDFCSTSRITITPDNVYDIFNAANRYLTFSLSSTLHSSEILKQLAPKFWDLLPYFVACLISI